MGSQNVFEFYFVIVRKHYYMKLLHDLTLQECVFGVIFHFQTLTVNASIAEYLLPDGQDFEVRLF